MKRYITIVLIVVGVTLALLHMLRISEHMTRVDIKPIGSNGIFVGDANKTVGFIDSVHNGASSYRASVNAMDAAEIFIRQGNNYFNSGDYVAALTAYKQAYNIDQNNRMFIGLEILRVYETMKRYDDALRMLDTLESTNKISPYGIQKFSAIRSRLLAEKKPK